MDAIAYKGYRGSVLYSADDGVWHGRVLGINGLVSYEGADAQALEQAFREAVDDYIAFQIELARRAPTVGRHGSAPGGRRS